MAAARAIAQGWRTVRPRDCLKLLPMSDGGDGFGELMAKYLQARARLTTVVDAALRPCRARWWYEPGTKTAIIDSARVIGLAMLPPGHFHPFELDTRGLGVLLAKAARSDVKRCLVGIGGSATNDGGFGMARALGWTFWDRSGKAITQWTNLASLARVQPPGTKPLFKEVTVAVDVANSLLGKRGASRVYGPQKGLRPADFSRAEACLGRLAQVVKRELGRDFARLPGAGAAGGLGFGFLAFLGARLVPGFEFFATHSQIEAHLQAADLVITGEGALDRSTLMGKGVGKVAKRCRQLGIPCLGLAGLVGREICLNKDFTGTYALVSFTTMPQAKGAPASWLKRVATAAAREWSGRSKITH